jgi:hypothetical protein
LQGAYIESWDGLGRPDLQNEITPVQKF